jgi:hypothetical protein
MSASILARLAIRRSSVSFRRPLNAGLAMLLFFLLADAANAYTLVLRSGRHVTVSGKFEVTPAAIICEVSPGYRVTVRLSSVDFAATERANSEPAGSFQRMIKRESERAQSTPARAQEALKPERTAGLKVITNKVLEPTRLTRESQDAEYERTRRERGMPSLQELRQRVAEQDRWLSEWAQRMREERMEAELESLRSELLNVRLHLSELSLSQEGVSYAPEYAPSNYYPYFYAPPAQLITVFPSGQRGLAGRGKFGRQTHGRPWLYQPQPDHRHPYQRQPYHARPGRRFPRIVRPFRGVGTLPPAVPRATAAPGHSR